MVDGHLRPAVIWNFNNVIRQIHNYFGKYSIVKSIIIEYLQKMEYTRNLVSAHFAKIKLLLIIDSSVSICDTSLWWWKLIELRLHGEWFPNSIKQLASRHWFHQNTGKLRYIKLQWCREHNILSFFTSFRWTEAHFVGPLVHSVSDFLWFQNHGFQRHCRLIRGFAKFNYA